MLAIFVAVFLLLAPLIASRPGSITPAHLEIEVGTDANITCSIEPSEFLEFSAPYNIYFEKVLANEPAHNVSKSAMVKLNDTVVVYMLRNASEQESKYRCMCSKYGIGESTVYVGTAPQDVTDFSCRNYDFDYIVCNFTQPRNTVPTRYDLKMNASNNKNYGYNITCNYENVPRVVCNKTLIDLNKAEKYDFRLEAVNSLGTNDQIFDINIYEVAVPAAPGIEFKQMDVTTDSLKVSWRMLKSEYYNNKGLKWEVIVVPHEQSALDYSAKATPVFSKRIRVFELKLDNLPYAYYEYDLRLRVKVHGGIAADDMWSAPYVHRFRTKPKRARAPLTAPGSFYVGPLETTVTLYWEQLELYEQSGPNFHYNFTYALLPPLNMGSHSAEFNWTKTVDYKYAISSCNDEGASDSAYFQLFARKSDNDKYVPRAIHNVYNATERTYTLTWQSPEQTKKLINYTVYWCHPQRERPYKCEGSIHFKNVSKDIHKFTTQKPKLTEQDQPLTLAVSANYEDYNTGMHWAPCTLDASSDLTKMSPQVQNRTNSSITIDWSSDNFCTSILEGYNLTYCEIDNEKQANCIDGTIERKMDRDVKKFNIGDLKPYTLYKIQMFMYSKEKKGKISEPLIERTDEAAPSPPLQVEMSNITNTSATVTWAHPSKPNGKIRFYVITANDITKRVSGDKTSYTLTNLTSFKQYKLFMVAETLHRSGTSNDVHFTTMIGTPSPPRFGNIRQNISFIQWIEPVNHAGRLDFYEVRVTQTTRNSQERRRISIVRGTTSCNWKGAICSDPDIDTKVEVRAVNAASLTSEVPVGSLAEQNPDIDALDRGGSDELACHGGNTENVTGEEELYLDPKLYRLYKSEWQTALIYGCSPNGAVRYTFYALILTMTTCALGTIIYMGRKKYKEMADLRCILPNDLNMYITKTLPGDSAFMRDNQSGGGVTVEKEEDMSHDFMFQKEKHHLLPAFRHESGYLGGGDNAFHRLAANAHTNGRSHSESSTVDSMAESVDSSTAVLDSTDGSHIQEQTVPSSGYVMTTELKPLTVVNPCNNMGGYIKPTNMLFDWQTKRPEPELQSNYNEKKAQHQLSWLPDTQYHRHMPDDSFPLSGGGAESCSYVNPNQLPSKSELDAMQSVPQLATTTGSGYVAADSFGSAKPPAAASTLPLDAGGYVQASLMQKMSSPLPLARPPPTNLSGYTTLDALGKLGAQVGLPSPAMTAQAEAHGTPSAASEPTPHSHTGISGYVTQRELSAFGQQQNIN